MFVVRRGKSRFTSALRTFAHPAPAHPHFHADATALVLAALRRRGRYRDPAPAKPGQLPLYGIDFLGMIDQVHPMCCRIDMVAVIVTHPVNQAGILVPVFTGKIFEVDTVAIKII